jgi:hypothetical protein
VSRSDVLAIIGLVLTVVLGIPAIPLFAKGNAALGALSGLLALVCFALTISMFWWARLPPWTIMSHNLIIDIRDIAGKSTCARKTVKLRSNHPGNKWYIHRNISFDGNVSRDVKVGPDVSVVKLEPWAGDFNVTVEFPTTLRIFESRETWLELEFQNAFSPSRRESVALLVDQPIKAATIQINLPSGVSPIDARTIYRSSGREEEVDPPIAQGHQLTWTRRRWRGLRSGEYEISWKW